jgi:hypothetical protein
MMMLTDVAVQGRYGWYRIPVYPLVYIGAAYIVVWSVRELSLPGMLATLVLGGATATTMVLGHLLQPNPYLLGAAIAVVLLPGAVAAWRESDEWRLAGRATAVAALVLIIGASAISSWILGDVYTAI